MRISAAGARPGGGDRVKGPDADVPAADHRPSSPDDGRERYLDLLRVAALVRVVAFHTTGWLWLSALFPAMGLMFGIAGCLMARSLDQGGPRAVGTRLARILPPFWLYGVVAVTLMLLAGWRPSTSGSLGWGGLAWWLLPLRVPPAGGPAWSWLLTIGLWYISTYLWLVLLSPLLRPLFRRRPWCTLGIATAVAVGVNLTHLDLPGYFVLTYAPCWLLGFARRDGLLQRIPGRAFGCGVGVLGAVGGMWMLVGTRAGTFGTEDAGGGNVLWSLALVAVVLRCRFRLDRLADNRWAGRALRAVNSRAVTVYLWHLPAGALAGVLLEDGSTGHLPLRIAGTVLLTASAVLLFGWAERWRARRVPPSRPSGPARRDTARSRPPT
ncbi:acyltransferase family protein [Plantactinospora sp. WMMB334]|uniref:acyltransferase family protein n=1 Tax=Plantactinospora sp. WMMB334 TaxID=3404119 RepID=UPI003B959DA2